MVKAFWQSRQQVNPGFLRFSMRGQNRCGIKSKQPRMGPSSQDLKWESSGKAPSHITFKKRAIAEGLTNLPDRSFSWNFMPFKLTSEHLKENQDTRDRKARESLLK
jgi:hypothetical protein